VRAVPGVDPALIDDAEARLRAMADLDPLGTPAPAGKSATAAGTGVGCVHGDAHPANVLWRDGRVVALLDFEWVRLGPADLELVPYLADHPGAGRQAEARTRSMLGWLAESHPAAFAPPRLLTRLWLYQIAYGLRQVLIHCPGRPPTTWPLINSCGDSAASSPVQAISNDSSRQLRKGKPLRDGRRCANWRRSRPMTTTVRPSETATTSRTLAVRIRRRAGGW
jgi:hypothetical protein